MPEDDNTLRDETEFLSAVESETFAGVNDERFHTFAENASDAIIIIDTASHIHFINRAAEKIFGYPFRELLGQSLTLLMPDYLRRIHHTALERYLATGVRHINWSSVEVPGLHRSGRELSLEISFGEFVKDGATFFTGIARDITERKRARASQSFLIEASALLAASLDYETTLQSVARLSVPFLADWCIVYVTDEEGAIRPIAVAHEDEAKAKLVWEVERNQNPQALTGVPQVMRTGQAELFADIPEVPAGDDDDGHSLRVARQLGLKSAMIVPLVARGRTLGAILFAFSESGRRYREIDLALAGDLAGRAALAVDNARLYREAQEANRLKDEFLATLSHELRTPLTSILGWTNLLRSVKFDEATSARALETIERNARSQKQLIDDLLDASRIITGKLRLDVRPTALRFIIEAATEAVRPAAAAKGIELRHALDPAVNLVAGDPERLQQVIWNLLSNAVKFTPENGRVEVRLGRAGARAQVSVSDTGPGIKTEFLPFVFDRFRQADQTTTRAHGGLGLGLAIVRHLVELHGGTVTAESAGEGLGATFIVSLPLLPLATDAAATATTTRHAAQPATDELADADALTRATLLAKQAEQLDGLRVLIVDDDTDTRVLLGKALERYGAQVKICELAAEALLELERGEFDVMLSDIGMPGADGYWLIKKIRELDATRRRRHPLPVIALTAYAREEDRQRALAAGFQLHLAKPITPKELVAAILDMAGRDKSVSL